MGCSNVSVPVESSEEESQVPFPLQAEPTTLPPLSFLDLPAELRLLVYGHLCSQVPDRSCHYVKPGA